MAPTRPAFDGRLEVPGRIASLPIWPRTVQGRDRLRTGAVLSGAALLGYLMTCVAYPAPLVPRDQAVSRVLGLPVAAAQKELEQQGFRIKLEEDIPDPVVPIGHVVWQDPPAEVALARGAVVRLSVSSGPGAVPVPDVLAFELDQARLVLEAAGLRLGDVDTVASAAEAGVIVATRPAAGATRAPGGPVDLVVSRGPADIRVPDVTGLRQEDARERLESLGLKVGAVTTRPARKGPPGLVIEQRPGPGILAPLDARVSLVISK